MSNVWFSVSEPRVYYRIPDDFIWSDHGVSVTNFEMQLNMAPLESLSPFEVSKSVAFGRDHFQPEHSAHEAPPIPPDNEEKHRTAPEESESQFENIGVLGVLGFLKEAVDEGLSMGEELLGQIDKDEAVALAKEAMEDALGMVSDLVDKDHTAEDTETETLTGLHLRSLFRQGLKDFRFSVQPREKTGTDKSEG